MGESGGRRTPCSWSNITVRVRTDSPCELVAATELLVPDDSGACRAAVRAFRPRRVIPAVLTASLLAAAGGTVAVHMISTKLGRPVLRPEVTAHAGRLAAPLRWGDPAVLAAGAGIALGGLLLLLSALLPGRTRTVPLAGDDPEFVMGVRRRSLRAALRAAALDVPGITKARVRLRGRLRPCVRVRAVTRFHNEGNLPDQVADAVRARLDDLGPARPTPVHVRLVTSGERGTDRHA